jgi:hypothetical protein
MVQLGVHIFSIFESVVVKRKTDRKYYEFLLHHFIATTLILFSLLINLLAVGTVILFLHDISDLCSDVSRTYVETKYRRSTILNVFFFLLAVLSWLYTRIIVFPSCAIWAIYDSLPGLEDQWRATWPAHVFLIVLNSMLVIMHTYWLSWMVLTGVRMAKGQGFANPHDKIKKTE